METKVLMTVVYTGWPKKGGIKDFSHDRRLFLGFASIDHMDFLEQEFIFAPNLFTLPSELMRVTVHHTLVISYTVTGQYWLHF